MVYFIVFVLIYIKLLKSVLTYGRESWSLNRKNVEELQVIERSLRKIFGPIRDNE